MYFLSTPGPPEVCEPGTALTYRNVTVYRIGPGDGFDLELNQTRAASSRSALRISA
jgi:hypothetical protein